MVERVETVIVGGGQAGLAASYWLGQQQREHVVLEQAAQVGNAWRNGRWDSFTLVTPNWMLRLPGAEYDGPEPDSFTARDGVVSYLEQYAARFRLPVRCNVRVSAVVRQGDGYRIKTTIGEFDARNVVTATGTFQSPKIPAVSARLPERLLQIHSSEYRNPDTLPEGAVLVVGSGQSGCQIAEELYQGGRKVYLCVGSAPRFPRRYRGKDITRWAQALGFFERRVQDLPSPRARFVGNPHFSGKDGGRSLNLHQFALDGVTLLGRIQEVRGEKVTLSGDLRETLARVDAFEAEFLKDIDRHIEQNGIVAPDEHPAQLTGGYQAEVIGNLDLGEAGITSVVWAAGYSYDFGLVKLPVVDEWGYPVQDRGVSAYPGLYFVGLHWLNQFKSGLFYGVGEDARYVAEQIGERG